ncbi:MAG: polysaccharide deacetylase family protein [Pseudomonadota bacterium]
MTPRILAILDREGVTATYFPIAATAARHPEVIRDFVASGHEIGNHSLAHRNLMKLSPAAQRADLAEANRILRGLGARPVLFRPPYASYDGHLVDTARSVGLETVLWSLDVRDWEVRDAGMLAARVSAGAGPALVVLMHATYEWTELALPRIIAALRDHGCRFVTLSQWLAFMQATPSAPGPRRRAAPGRGSATERDCHPRRHRSSPRSRQRLLYRRQPCSAPRLPTPRRRRQLRPRRSSQRSPRRRSRPSSRSPRAFRSPSPNRPRVPSRSRRPPIAVALTLRPARWSRAAAARPCCASRATACCWSSGPTPIPTPSAAKIKAVLERPGTLGGTRPQAHGRPAAADRRSRAGQPD